MHRPIYVYSLLLNSRIVMFCVLYVLENAIFERGVYFWQAFTFFKRLSGEPLFKDFHYSGV